MPQKLEGSITKMDERPEEGCKHVAQNCLWTITSQNTSLTVIKTSLKCTFVYDFCVRVTDYPLGSPTDSKQIHLEYHHPLFRSLTDALIIYEAFPESQSNFHQL